MAQKTPTELKAEVLTNATTNYVGGLSNTSLFQALLNDIIDSMGGGLITSLTTTGISGVATLINGDLNIPNYSSTGYVLPKASSTVLGGIQIGTGLNIDGNGKVSTNTSFNTYTPSIGPIGIANCTSGGIATSFYTVVGNIVNVSITMLLAISESGTFAIQVSLPLVSNFTSQYDLSGVASNQNGITAGVLAALPSNNYASVQGFSANALSSQPFYIQLTYIIK